MSVHLSKPPHIQDTLAETFILESLSLEDESHGRMDGRVLFDTLKLQGKNPRYYYFRTAEELIKFSDIFRQSGCRYLHLSCHGSESTVVSTFNQLNYTMFANIFEGKLRNRRLFISGCNLGNRAFADILFSKNRGMYSITAPTRTVFFGQTVAFWPTFHHLMYIYDSAAMKKSRLLEVLGSLTGMFEMPLLHSYHNTVGGKICHKQFGQAATARVMCDLDK